VFSLQDFGSHTPIRFGQWSGTFYEEGDAVFDKLEVVLIGECLFQKLLADVNCIVSEFIVNSLCRGLATGSG
jgi:hypothetical protein